MKRCPNCNRSFPDDNQKFCTVDGGALVMADQAFDPNATIAAPANVGTPAQEPAKERAANNPPTDFGATIATPSSAPTVVLPRKTGPTGSSTSSNMPPPQTSAPQHSPGAVVPPPQPQGRSAPLPATPGAPPSRPQTAPLPRTPSAPLPAVPVAPKKKSKLPLILGILAILFVLGAGALVALFFVVVKPWLDQRNAPRPPITRQTQNQNQNTNTSVNTNTQEVKPEEPKTEPEFVAPANTTKFTNSKANLDGKLAEHYFEFSFYYPDNWAMDPKAGVPGASNFAKVERKLPPDFTQENFAVGWYTSEGSFAADESIFPKLVAVLGKNLAGTFPGYKKVSEGPTKVNSLDGYEFRFVSMSKGSEKGDIHLWGRVIFLPTGVPGDTTGATLVMLTTSLAPELSGVEDVGQKGQMPVILDSFRFGKRK